VHAAFQALGSAMVDQSVSFSAGGSRAQGGQIVRYAWDFGDGSSGQGANVSHTYTKVGRYRVTLTVTSSDGAQGTASHTINVERGRPRASIDAPSTGAANLPVGFDAGESSAQTGRIIGYTWDFGDGARAAGAQVAHSYTRPDTYQLTLTVIDNYGGRTSITHTIRIDQ
jgi:PKD repeat protein